MSWLIPILAQAEATAPAERGPGMWQYLPIVVMALMVFLFFRASARQRKEHQKALAMLKKNDRVVTSGGILGVVVAMKEGEDEVTLRVDDTSNTRIRVLRSSIVKITPGDAPSEPKTT